MLCNLLSASSLNTVFDEPAVFASPSPSQQSWLALLSTLALWRSSVYQKHLGTLVVLHAVL
jgi:hypothetical protein